MFYRTCKPEQRQDFDQLKGTLSKHFTPVRIPVVDSNLFHKRTQRKNETVDKYAQELKQLVLQGITLISTKDEGDGSKCLDMSVRGRSSPRH